MSRYYNHGGGGGGQRSQQRQSSELYDPFSESDYGDGGGAGRFAGQVRRDGGGREGLVSRSYGSYSSVPSPVPRKTAYGDARNSNMATYSTSQGFESSFARRDSGFPSGIQESDVWRSKGGGGGQRSSGSDTRRNVQNPVWGDPSNIQGGRYGQSSAYKNPGQDVQMGMGGGTGAQPVLMMLPPGAGNSLMGMGVVAANPFAVQQRSGQLQMLVGSLPSNLNPNIFDQQQLMSGSGNYGGHTRQQQQHSVPRSGSGRSSSSSYGRDRQSSSSRGHGTPPSGSVRRRISPNRAPRNAVYRKPININPPNNSPRKRVPDRADFGDRKKFKEDRPERVARISSTSIKRPSGNQKRKDKRKRDKIAAASTTTTSSGSVKSPEKKIEQTKKEEEKKKDDSDEVMIIEPSTTETMGKTKKSETETEKVETVTTVNTEVKKSEVETVTIVEVADAGEKSEEEKRKRSKYDDFPSVLLVCKVCQKSMNDGASFESHLSGRAHMALVKVVEERFQKRADLLMFESKLAEEEIGIELERQKRAGKSGGTSNKNHNHCKMCDCNYTVNWGTHKISLGHRILKEFLHPQCRICDMNFVHRMDWLNHLFSLTHLRRMSEQKHAGKDTSAHESQSQDELFTINIEMNKDEKPLNILTIRNKDWKIPTAAHMRELLQEDEELQIPEEDIVLPEDHDGTVATGKEMILSTTGFCCKVCRTYMTQEKDVDPHCMSKSHFGMYVSHLKKLIKLKEEAVAFEKSLAEEEKRKAEKEALKREQEAAAVAAQAKEKQGLEEDKMEGIEVIPVVKGAVAVNEAEKKDDKEPEIIDVDIDDEAILNNSDSVEDSGLDASGTFDETLGDLNTSMNTTEVEEEELAAANGSTIEEVDKKGEIEEKKEEDEVTILDSEESEGQKEIVEEESASTEIVTPVQKSPQKQPAAVSPQKPQTAIRGTPGRGRGGYRGRGTPGPRGGGMHSLPMASRGAPRGQVMGTPRGGRGGGRGGTPQRRPVGPRGGRGR